MPLIPDQIQVSNVSRETLNNASLCYDRYHDAYSLLIDKWLWWNRSVNLMSRNTTSDHLKLHILHSLLLLFECRCEDHEIVLDAGTGGGLPGLPMAIADPTIIYWLTDKVSKKQIALKNIIKSLSVRNAHAICEDINKLEITGSLRVVSKHAFHIPDILKYLEKCSWKEISMLKGDDLFNELNPEIINKYDLSIKKIDGDSSFFHNKYIISIMNPANSMISNEQ